MFAAWAWCCFSAGGRAPGNALRCRSVEKEMRFKACWSNLLPRAAFALLALAPACVWAAAGAGLPAAVAEVMAAQRLPSSAVSIVVVDPVSGRVLLSHNPDTPRSPASTIKTVTTFAALDELGPAYMWHTSALIRGTLNAGVLDGDLILRGGGDPYMTMERWWSFARTVRGKG